MGGGDRQQRFVFLAMARERRLDRVECGRQRGQQPRAQRRQPDPAALPLAIEEYLRYVSPNPGMERLVTRETHGSWGSARAGDAVILGWGPANHDPSVFDEPGTIRLDRRPNPHVAFGSGPHTCIGIHLARLEARVFLEELLAAVPAWQLAATPDLETLRLAGDTVPARFDALPLEVQTRGGQPR